MAYYIYDNLLLAQNQLSQLNTIFNYPNSDTTTYTEIVKCYNQSKWVMLIMDDSYYTGGAITVSSSFPDNWYSPLSMPIP
jgi:hypothetical protein